MIAPTDVWKIIERADERIKYAQNRDPAEAYRQAREALAQARAALAGVADERARAGLLAQIERRETDLDALERAT
ncbi:MAG TPA: hypothetical protein VGB64_01730 [Actinomycetota bacterium]